MFLSLLLLPFYAYFGILWTAILAAILIGLFYYIKTKNEYFPKNGIKSIPSYVPLVGGALKALLQMEHFLDMINRYYKEFPEEKYFGFQNFSSSIIYIKDLEIIKQVGIKDFDHFIDHLSQIDESVDPLFGNNIAALKGQKWRDMRATLSPAFTSSKMKGMFDFVSECGDQMAKFFLKQADEPEHKAKTYIQVDLKDIFTRYANDVIATSAFGINIDSLQNKDNEFYLNGKKATNLTGKQMFKYFAMISLPKLTKFFNIKPFDSTLTQFFRDLVNGSMKIREEQGIVRHDMIHLLMEAKKGTLKHETKKDDKDAGFATVEESDMGKEKIKRVWTDDEIVAQAVVFLLAGFDTSSTLLSFLAHELAINPDIQKRLQDEIDKISDKNYGKVRYDDLQHMKYMDMVVSETLRYWPPAIATDRKCVKPYTLPPSNDNSQVGGKVNVGDGISIPIYPIHHDPQYYKDPEKFDPERFSDENKHEINPLAYMPFGVGPRNCIGSRFALMETKSAAFYLLRHFDLVVTEKTQIPLVFKRSSFNLIPTNGFWIGLKPREK